VVANVIIAGCKSDVVESNKHVNYQLVARTYSSTPNGKTQIPTEIVPPARESCGGGHRLKSLSIKNKLAMRQSL